ncbi:hypothetical protein Tco_1561369 [Tanacetum coccineum]
MDNSRSCRDIMSNLFTPADNEFFNEGVRDKSAIKRSWKLLCQSAQQQANTLLRFEALTEEHDNLERVEELEKDKAETEEVCMKQADRIKQLEAELKQSEVDTHQLRVDGENFDVECGNGEMVRCKIINDYLPTFVCRLHQSDEYKWSLGEAFSLAIGKGFIDGISIGRKDPDIQAILTATLNVDPASSNTFMETYESLFDKRYPYLIR